MHAKQLDTSGDSAGVLLALGRSQRVGFRIEPFSQVFITEPPGSRFRREPKRLIVDNLARARD